MNKKTIFTIILWIGVASLLYFPFSQLGLFLLNKVFALQSIYGHCVQGICPKEQNQFFDAAIRLIAGAIFVSYIYLTFKITSLIIKTVKKPHSADSFN